MPKVVISFIFKIMKMEIQNLGKQITCVLGNFQIPCILIS